MLSIFHSLAYLGHWMSVTNTCLGRRTSSPKSWRKLMRMLPTKIFQIYMRTSQATAKTNMKWAVQSLRSWMMGLTLKTALPIKQLPFQFKEKLNSLSFIKMHLCRLISLKLRRKKQALENLKMTSSQTTLWERILALVSLWMLEVLSYPLDRSDLSPKTTWIQASNSPKRS